MSLKTKIRGYTAWVNLRLKPYDQLMNNVVMDLLTGTNMKLLLLSMTGADLKRLDTLDGLTQSQKMSRVEWSVEELKKYKIIPDDVFVDFRMFAMRNADHIFKLLWRLVSHDIWFVWERAEYLTHQNNEVLTEVPFKWIPEPPPVKKKKPKNTRTSLLSGFGSSAIITEKIEEDEEADITPSYDPFPRSEYMKRFRPKYNPEKAKEGTKHLPAPEDCILEMVNKQLKGDHCDRDNDEQTNYEGRKLNVTSIDDLVDSRVLCALVNSFVPNTFTTEVLLNDRWTINTVMRTVEKMLYISSPFDSEDLAEADKMSVCSYFCVFFMTAFKYRQARAVYLWVEHLKQVQRENQVELDQFPEKISKVSDLQRHRELKVEIDNIKLARERLAAKFDMNFVYEWIIHVKETVKKLHKDVQQKMKDRFDTIQIPRNISINDFCLSLVINLTLTNGSGFYKADSKETISEGRKVVLRNKDTGEFVDDFTGRKKQDSVRKLLGLPSRDVVEVNPDKYTKYEIFLESQSRNKMLRPGFVFLYQVFPGTTVTWQKIFIKAVKDNEIETVQRFITFFRTNGSFINCRDPQTGNSPLHWACRLGQYEIVQYLLESGANIDQRNGYKQTPLFCACEGLNRDIAHLLIEWGCDVHIKGPRNQVAFETVKNDEFRDLLIDAYQFYSTNVPKVMEGDTKLLYSMVRQHMEGTQTFNNLRSRCINGSTLLHTAAYFGCIPIIQNLMKLGVDVNLLDYKGSTALHRATDVATIHLLMELGASPSVEDSEGNTPLHVKCYGETGKPSEVDAVTLLLGNNAKLLVRNHRGLMPIHCCAMQGRMDVIQMLLETDKEDSILRALQEETGPKPPSVVHLAIANNFIDCAEGLLSHGFSFKNNEQDVLLQRLLSEQVKLEQRAEAITFLLEHGADYNPVYPGGNSVLHYAASMSGSTDVLETLMEYGADVDVVNEDGATPLFYACQCNNQFAASVLISQGANVRIKNLQGLTAFDFILDYDEWIECGYFNDEIRARLKAYSLKHSRDLIRAISKKVKAPQHSWSLGAPGTAYSSATALTRSRSHVTSGHTMRTESAPAQLVLPPVKKQPLTLGMG